MTQYKYDVFLSHNSADKDIVRHVATQLRNAGLRVWFDEWNITIGDDIYLSIESGLEQSRALVLFISRNALKSNWISLERSTALFRDPTNKTRRFLPILIDECNIPKTLGRYKYLDFRQDQEKGVAQLIKICKGQTCEPSLRPKISTLDEYRKSHISRYADLTEGRHLIKVTAIGRSGSLVDAGMEIESWISSMHSSRLAVLGDPGSGKTYLLRQLCSILSERSEFTPVFINAGQLRNLLPSTRQDLLAFADPPVPSTAILKMDNIVVIIDGLDELIGPTLCRQIEYSKTLDAVGQLIPDTARLILSCRSTTFEATSKVVSETLGVRPQMNQSSDETDKAIQMALGIQNNRTLEQIELTELTKNRAHIYLSATVGTEVAENNAAAYVLEHLPRVPVVLRYLELALPELQCSFGGIDLDELYATALRAWILRDPAFAGQNIDVIWNELRANHSLGTIRLSDSSCVDRLIHAGLLEKTPWGGYTWSHFSINEFFSSNYLFEQIRKYNAATLATLDLIGSYNINRFLVPMCRREIRTRSGIQVVQAVNGGQYNTFLQASGWRRRSGYGMHPSFIAQDGTGFTSGIDDLEPEPYAQPAFDHRKAPVCGVSWYDAFVYCLWSGDSLPDSRQFSYDSSLLPGLWYWCADWSLEKKAHVAVITYDSGSMKLYRGGVNPDFRHSRVAIATIRNSRSSMY